MLRMVLFSSNKKGIAIMYLYIYMNGQYNFNLQIEKIALKRLCMIKQCQCLHFRADYDKLWCDIGGGSFGICSDDCPTHDEYHQTSCFTTNPNSRVTFWPITPTLILFLSFTIFSHSFFALSTIFQHNTHTFSAFNAKFLAIS